MPRKHTNPNPVRSTSPVSPANRKPLKSRRPYTGFRAYYANGKIVKEKENYFSKKLNRKCATNWMEIDKDQLVALELVWKDQVKYRIEKAPCSEHSRELNPGDWFFSQKGYMDLGKRKIIVIARNIGYIEDGVVNVTSVMEETGIIRMYTKAV